MVDSSDLGVIENSWDLWKFLLDYAGLDPDGYDQELVLDLKLRLRLPLDEGVELADLLKKNRVSTEDFLTAFFKSIEPYVGMYRDVLLFFQKEGIKFSDNMVQIKFDFGKISDELEINLEHFKRIMRILTEITADLLVYPKDQRFVWGITNILWKYSQNPPEDDHAKRWDEEYERGYFSLPLPELPPVGDEEIDATLGLAWNIWVDVITEIMRYTSETCRQKRWWSFYEEETRGETVTGEKGRGWDPKTLLILDSDYWPNRTLRGLFNLTEAIITGKIHQDELRQTIEELKKHLSVVQRVVSKKTVSQLLELLDLPFWKKRYLLYQVWILTQLLRALDAYNREVHIVNNKISFKWTGSHLGTIYTRHGRIHVWSELRSPFYAPIGKGRKRGIKPDYSLTMEPITEPETTLIAIECKQYKRGDARNFMSAVVDYARGLPNARVILVNYGAIPPSLHEVLKDKFGDVKGRIYLIGHMRPGVALSFENFRKAIIDGIPPPERTLETMEVLGTLNERDEIEVIAVDISGSMDDALSSFQVKNLLNFLVSIYNSATLVAVDTTIRGKWSNPREGINHLLKLDRSRGTDLPEALKGYKHLEDKMILITDKQGLEQILGCLNPKILVVLGEARY